MRDKLLWCSRRSNYKIKMTLDFNNNNSINSSCYLTDDEIEILEIYRSASEEGKELLINKLMELLEENK